MRESVARQPSRRHSGENLSALHLPTRHCGEASNQGGEARSCADLPAPRGHCPRLQQKSPCPGTERPTRSASVLSVSFVRDPLEPCLSGQGLLPKIPGVPLRSLRSFAAKPTPLLFHLRSASHQRFASGWPAIRPGTRGHCPRLQRIQSRKPDAVRRGQKNLWPPCTVPSALHRPCPLSSSGRGNCCPRS